MATQPADFAAASAPTLIFTDAAAAKVGELISEESNPNLKLRVFVQGGGCSGFQYGFTFDENVEEGDTQVGNRGVTLLIDSTSPARKSTIARISKAPSSSYAIQTRRPRAAADRRSRPEPALRRDE